MNLNTLKILSIIYLSKDEIKLERKLIEKNLEEKKKENSEYAIVMIGTGENSCFIKVKKGEKILTGSGENSCFVRAGISVQEEREEIDERIKKLVFSKKRSKKI